MIDRYMASAGPERLAIVRQLVQAIVTQDDDDDAVNATRGEPTAIRGASALFENAVTCHPRGVVFAADVRARALTLRHRSSSPGRDASDGDGGGGGGGGGSELPAPAVKRGVRALDAALQPLLLHWFGEGMLQVRRVEWQDSAETLDFIAKRETVHPTDRLTTFKRKFGHGRRCFALFHPCLPSEPVCFVHTALTADVSDSLSHIRASTGTEEGERAATSAVFYSIATAHDGLRGLNVARRLIGAARNEVARQHPHISNFVTLSPVPGLRGWLNAQVRHWTGMEGPGSPRSGHAPHGGGPPGGAGIDVLVRDDAEAAALIAAATAHGADAGVTDPSSGSAAERGARAVLSLLEAHWHRDPQAVAALRGPLVRAAAHYIVHAKHAPRRAAAASTTSAAAAAAAPSAAAAAAVPPPPKPHCAVASFHLSNGAVVGRVNFLANLAPKGLRESGGVMVNYLYEGRMQQGGGDGSEALPPLLDRAREFARTRRVPTTAAVRALDAGRLE